MKHEHTNKLGSLGHAPPRKFEIFRSPKTASTGNAPKTRILLILSLSMGMHPYSGTTNCTARGARG